MAKLEWGTPGKRLFETGLDRGVLYLKSPENVTSSVTRTIGLGSKTFPLDGPRPYVFQIGATIRVDSVVHTNRWMIGKVTDHDTDSVTILVTSFNGSPDSYKWSFERLDVAVAWVGLTGVDEAGAESSSTYYIDGQPFLQLPKPKEYAATIRAYTYPDEFAYVQGLVEATDGMYLDSQQGEPFNMSYRTLIGNDLEGVDFGYKIHLVYNATVTPEGAAYSTATETTNPMEFSWGIQAVPVPVVGYRSTAHIIIDTRHMDADKLADIEELLYGTESTFGSIPDPQVIFDTLSYGDTITIWDNGDGSWEAKGSYENIYMIGDGIFQIDNVNAVDNGDGTYTFSTGGNTVVL